MVDFHSHSAPTAIAELTGDPLPDYGKGRVCAHEGCPTILRRANPSRFCSLHQDAPDPVTGTHYHLRTEPVERICERCGGDFETRSHKAKYCSQKCRMKAFGERRKGAPASACGAAATTAAPAPRKDSKEGTEMAVPARGKTGATKAAVLAFLAERGDWCRSAEVAEACGIGRPTAKTHLRQLAEQGKVESRLGAHGGGGYRLRQDPPSCLTKHEGPIPPESTDHGTSEAESDAMGKSDGPVKDASTAEGEAAASQAQSDAADLPPREAETPDDVMRCRALQVFANDTRLSWPPTRMAAALGILRVEAIRHLDTLVESGALVHDERREVYRLPGVQDLQNMAASPSEPPAHLPEGEHPAEAAVPGPADDAQHLEGPPPAVGPRPFAGLDAELTVLTDTVRIIGSLPGAEARARVAAYVAARYL
jgi:biotin operon repressor